MTKYKRTELYNESTVDEQAVLMPNEKSDKKEILYVNDTGIQIFKYLQKPRTKDEIDKYIMELYECHDDSIITDNKQYLDLLIDKGVVFVVK